MSSDVATSVASESTDRAIDARRWHLPQLDGLRGIAIASVVIGHGLLATTENPRTEAVGHALAAFGVSLFFVLSGFLITSLLMREDRRSGSIDLRGFYGRRFLRIFPAYFVYIAFVFAVDRAGIIERVTPHDYVASAFFARNLVGHSAATAHLWSLSLEEQFYLLWPGAMSLLPSRTRAGFVVTATLVITGWRFIVLHFGWFRFGALYERTDLRIDTILAGCALALVGVPALRDRLHRNVAAVGGVLVGVLAAGFAVNDSNYCGFFYPLLSIALVTTLGASVSATQGGLWNLLTLPSLRWLGRISYSLYLWHGLFVGKPNPIPGHLPPSIAPALMLAFLAATASYYLVEQPIVRMKDAWATARAGRRAHLET